MKLYSHILVGLDLTAESEKVLKKAGQLAELYGAKISLIHVLEPLTFAYAGDLPVDLVDTQNTIQQHAKTKMKSFSQTLPMPTTFCDAIVGPTAGEMRQKAQDLEADLIVVGSHGRHGLSLLLGNTASDLLHGAKCDVLAIRI